MLTQKIKQAIEDNPGVSMIAAGIVGLAFPYGASIPNAAIIIILAILIFLSCFKITVQPRAALSWKPVAFCLVRYAALPIILWFACKSMIPTYAVGVLLLALCPAGVSSSGLAGMYNGNVALAFAITIMSNIACIILIPGEMSVFNHSSIAPDVSALSTTIVLCILLPGILYIPLRHRKILIDYSHTYGRLTVVILLSFMTFVALSKNRDYFLSSPQDTIVPILLSAGFYVIAVTFGFAIKEKRPERITYGTCSAFNNNGLGIGLALMYFDEKAIAVLVASEVMWSFLPVFVQSVIKHLPPDNN